MESPFSLNSLIMEVQIQLLGAAPANFISQCREICWNSCPLNAQTLQKQWIEKIKSGKKKKPFILGAKSYCTFIQPHIKVHASSETLTRCRYVPMSVTGTPYSKAEIAVHFPVPFCPALSLILGSRWVPSESLYFRMFAVISIRNESSSVLFHWSKAWWESSD